MAVYTDDYVVCGCVNKIASMGIMAAAEGSKLGKCVEHTGTKLIGCILNEDDKNFLVFL
jgi:hypothetical protein